MDLVGSGQYPFTSTLIHKTEVSIVKILSGLLVLISVAMLPSTTTAQNNDHTFMDSFNSHFNYASMRISSLAEAVPEELYDWRPGEGVMSFAEVVAHIARYNYFYPVEIVGHPVSADIDLDNMESLTDKRRILAELERSIDYVRRVTADMTEEDLLEPARLYGQDMNLQAVYLQLITHKGEHLGQAIAYARMNGIVPPWSR